MPVDVDVRQELEMIAKLQEIDNRLLELEQEKGDLPGIVKHLDSEIQRIEKEIKTLHQNILEIGKKRRTIEGQNQLVRVKQDKFKEQLYQVTTNREYDAITQEIESIRIEIETNETTQLEIAEQSENLQAKLEESESRSRELKHELEERRLELGEKEEETEQEELEYRHEREKLEERIKKPILAHYERIREAKGAGAAPLYDSACGACFAVVPPQRQSEIRKMSDIILCESCGVILLPESEK